MRYQKYKAYLKEFNKIAPVQCIEWIDGKLDHIHIEGGMAFDMDEIELLEYTGQKDKNDIEIYEGNIISDGIYKYSIKYNSKLSRFIIIGIDNRIHEKSFINGRQYEVVGNYIISKTDYSVELTVINERFKKYECTLKEVLDMDEITMSKVGNKHTHPELLK